MSKRESCVEEQPCSKCPHGLVQVPLSPHYHLLSATLLNNYILQLYPTSIKLSLILETHSVVFLHKDIFKGVI